MSYSSFNNNSDIFFKEIDFSKELKQYDRCYNTRISKLKELIIKRIGSEWGSKIEINKSIPDCKDKEVSVIIGVLYKEMPLKPNPLLDGFSKSLIRESYVLNTYNTNDRNISLINKGNKSDMIFLEDNEGKVLLDVSNLSNTKNDTFLIDNLYSGVVVGLKGSYNYIQGYFSVLDFIYPYKISIERMTLQNNPSNERPYILFTSGLNLGNESISKEKLSLIEYFNNKPNSKVYKLILIGETIKVPYDIEEYSDDSEHNQIQNKNITVEYIKNIQSADNFLSLLSEKVHVEIIPSEKEPTNFTYPQLPINKNILMKCKEKKNLTTVSNPYYSIFNIQNNHEILSNPLYKDDFFIKNNNKSIKFLFFSSQIINTIKKYTLLTDESHIISSLFEYGHFCPIMPDMLRSYPLKDIDPFLIEFSNPDVVVFGGCEKFDCFDLLFNGQFRKVITVPKFQNKNSIVYYDILNNHSFEVSV